MKITGTKFFLIETPRETGSISEHVMVRIDTDEGATGWGELSDLAHGHPIHFPNFELLEQEANRRIAGADPRNINQTLERIDMPCDPAGPILYTEDCTLNRVQYEDSCLVVPDGPGLGVDVDEEHLEELRYKGTRLKRLTAA